jgi:hypothetical protein
MQNYIFTIVNYILASENNIRAFVIFIFAFVKYILAYGNNILLQTFRKQKRKPTAKENAHFVFCPTLLPEKYKKSISLPSFANAKKGTNFPHLSYIFTNTLNKKHSI